MCAAGLQQVMGPGTLLGIPFGLAECPWVVLRRRLDETGDPGCTVPGTEESEEDIAGLPALVPIYPEPEIVSAREELNTVETAPGDPGATGSGRV